MSLLLPLQKPADRGGNKSGTGKEGGGTAEGREEEAEESTAMACKGNLAQPNGHGSLWLHM